MKNIISFFFMSFLILIKSHAQDVHWSQPSNSLLYQNPAFTGINNKFGLTLNYRSQWNAVNTNYTSYLFSGDYRFGKDEPKKASLSVGGILFSGVVGDGNYRTTNGGITFSCLVKATDKIRIGGGLGYNMMQSSLQINNYTWGSQFDGQNYNSSLSSGENFGSASKVTSDLNAGVSMAYDKNSTNASNQNTKFIAGYSINHINRPDIAINGGSDKLNMKHVLFATGNIFLKNNISLKPTVLFYKQGTLNEFTVGSLCRFTVGQHSLITGYKKGSAISFGVLYRVNDAVIPTAEFELKNYVFGISYDVNVSSLSAYSHYKGGFEVTLRLIKFGTYLYKDYNKQ